MDYPSQDWKHLPIFFQGSDYLLIVGEETIASFLCQPDLGDIRNVINGSWLFSRSDVAFPDNSGIFDRDSLSFRRNHTILLPILYEKGGIRNIAIDQKS